MVLALCEKTKIYYHTKIFREIDLQQMHDLIHIINENVDFKEFVREKTRNYLLSKILREDNFLLKTVAFTKFL